MIEHASAAHDTELVALTAPRLRLAYRLELEVLCRLTIVNLGGLHGDTYLSECLLRALLERLQAEGFDGLTRITDNMPGTCN